MHAPLHRSLFYPFFYDRSLLRIFPKNYSKLIRTDKSSKKYLKPITIQS